MPTLQTLLDELAQQYGCTLTITAGPSDTLTQVQGTTADGKHIYYRNRDGHWYGCIANTLDAAVDSTGQLVEPVFAPNDAAPEAVADVLRTLLARHSTRLHAYADGLTPMQRVREGIAILSGELAFEHQSRGDAHYAHIGERVALDALAEMEIDHAAQVAILRHKLEDAEARLSAVRAAPATPAEEAYLTATARIADLRRVAVELVKQVADGPYGDLLGVQEQAAFDALRDLYDVMRRDNDTATVRARAEVELAEAQYVADERIHDLKQHLIAQTNATHAFRNQAHAWLREVDSLLAGTASNSARHDQLRVLAQTMRAAISPEAD